MFLGLDLVLSPTCVVIREDDLVYVGVVDAPEVVIHLKEQAPDGHETLMHGIGSQQESL